MRSRKNYRELVYFGVVGLSGVVINMLVMVALTVTGPSPEGAVAQIVGTPFHVRWYHVFSFAAFLAANLWNYQLNRTWTFRSRGPWWRQYRDFLLVGALVQGLGLLVLTMLMHPHSPISLSRQIFDDSSFLLTRVYWAQLITVGLMTPISFVVNKVWTFRRS